MILDDDGDDTVGDGVDGNNQWSLTTDIGEASKIYKYEGILFQS